MYHASPDAPVTDHCSALTCGAPAGGVAKGAPMKALTLPWPIIAAPLPAAPQLGEQADL